MSAQRAAQIAPAIHYLQACNISLHELLLAVLSHGYCNDPATWFYSDLINHADSVLCAFRDHAATAEKTQEWSRKVVTARCSEALQELTSADHGWHFSAMHARPEQIEDFKIEEMAAEIARVAPELWTIVRTLLRGAAVEEVNMSGPSDRPEEEPDVDDAALWNLVGDLPGDESSAPGTKLGPKARRRLRELREALVDVKAVVIISILMHNRNQWCNTLQSVFGIFLHSCNTPEKLVKVLAHMGLSISLRSVHRALKSLSITCEDKLFDLGQTLLTAHGYDNFDADSRALIPTIENSKERLMHLTSGAIFRLDHGVKLEHLRCSRLLWERSELNPFASDPRPFDPHTTLMRMMTLHPEPLVPAGGLSRRGRIRAFFLLRTLFQHGPPLMRQHLASLPKPEPIESIPVTKLQFMPYRAMDINQSKVSGNIEAIQNIFRQAGLGDPSKPGSIDLEDISEYVTIMHGDLGTYERVLSAKRQRSQEKTPYNRLQSVEFVIGLFHFKMAAADALWRALVAPEHSREDSTSFMKIVAKLRPDDSSRLVNNAKFREQHELIEDVGTVLRLDAWRAEICKRGKYASLEEWAASNPSMSEIEEVADCLVKEYVEGEGLDLYTMANQSAANHDPVRENTMRTHHLLLLYDELSYALNAGDIGRVENLFVPWVLLFRATGKHKYGTQTLRFMHALYFLYPEDLRKAIRYNMLVNPTGKAHHFRAVDWIIELLNLYIKYMYGGSGSNNTKERILLESILVLLFRSSHANFERNFQLSGLSFAHTQKDMRKTYAAVLKYLQEEQQRRNTFKAGRMSKYAIPNLTVRGAETMEREAYTRRQGQPEEMTGDGSAAEGASTGELTGDDLSTEGVI